MEVESQTTSTSPKTAEVLTTEKTRTAVSVDLLRDQGPVLWEDGRAVEVPLDGVLVVEGCVHLEQHLHVYLVEGDLDSERTAIEVVREWSSGSCGRKRRE